MSYSATNSSGAGCRLVLVRHAHTAMAGTFCGVSDPPLSAEGLAQLPALNQRLEAYRVTHVFSSPLQRARQTATAIAQERGLQVHYVEFLHELAFGSWEGLDWDQVVARDPEYAQRWLDLYPSVPAPGGEYFSDFMQRILHAMSDITGQIGNGCAAVVTHGGVIRTFLGEIARQQDITFDPIQCSYTSCWEVWRDEGHWTFPAETIGTAATNCAVRPEVRDRGHRL
ncbi:MAG TPA: histidine phosphatase family protein [Candidatus Angelobacter sp.]|nr:histidine phosphatase family protein [Candidatus Angelobacter sp.]